MPFATYVSASIKAMLIKATLFSTCSASLLLCSTACHSFKIQEQNTVVPETVEAAFQAKYSDIPHTWAKQHYGYEAIFTQNNIKYEAEFSDTGKWLETEYFVTEKEFPSAVLKRIKQEYPKFLITKYEIEITPQGQFYEVDITDGEIEDELYFDINGNTIVDLYED